MAGIKAVVAASYSKLKIVKPGQAARMKVKAAAGNYICEEGVPHEHQDNLWQDFFLDPTQWWDNRQEKRSLYHPDFRHKRLKEALWLDNLYKPAWVDLRLARWDAERALRLNEPFGCASTSTSGSEIAQISSELKEAVEALEDLVRQGSYVSNGLFYRVLKKCVAQRDMVIGRRVHALALRSGLGSDEFLANHIIGMYASHGRLEEATQVFTNVAAPNSFMWASIISAHTRHGQASHAINLYQQMRQSTVKPNSHVFVAALKACATAADLHSGKQVHTDILASVMKDDVFVGNSLVNMYAKCGSLDNARRVFDTLPTRDTVTWNAMIAGYVQHGLGQESLNLYANMQLEGITPADRVTFVCLLQACASIGELHQGKQLHAQVQEKGLEGDLVVGSCLVDMYAKCGSLEDAQKVFKALPNKNVVTWNSMIAGYAKHGLGQEALACFTDMQEDGRTPADRITFVSLLQACASLGALHQGKQIHTQIQEKWVKEDVVVGSCLVDMYVKCRSLEDARKVFESLTTKNVVTWTAIIAGYAQHGFGQEAISLYASMEQVGITPADRVTFVCLLQAFARIGALYQGKLLHTQICLAGLEDDAVVSNSLVNMYVKCGSLEDARRVFDRVQTRDVVTWTTMIAGYAQQGHGWESLALYSSMQQDGMTPADTVTFGCLLHACAGIRDLSQGKKIHADIQQSGLEADVVVGNCLVDMYAKCGSLEDARQVFDRLPTRNVVTLNCMITAYAQHGFGQAALTVFEQSDIVLADTVTLVSLLKACASLGALQQGKKLHAQIQERGLECDVILGSCLVDMYAKCGSMEDARQLFDRVPIRDLVIWNALLNGYAQNSQGDMTLWAFQEMQEQGVKPDEVTFTCLLVACSRHGLVEEGQQYFKMMVEDHGISPDPYHYACMVDLFGRSGYLDRAEQVLHTMPFENDIVGWTTLLSACKRHMDADRGRQCFDRLISLEPDNATAYVLMANTYADLGRWMDVDRIETLRKSAGVKKKPAKACIEVQKHVHEFIVGEEKGGISSRLRSMSSRLIEKGGHVPHTQLVLKAVSDREKEDALCGHAEKLALAYGLLNTPDGATLLVTKNLRMCDDCHSSTKVMSRWEKREIIVRDSLCVHRFLDGVCSCGDQH